MNKMIWLLALITFQSAGCFAQADPTVQEKNKKIVVAMNELFNNNKPEEAMRYFSDSLTKMGNLGGKGFFRAMQDDILQTFPDIQTNILSMWADGDWVIADCIFTGTHKGVAVLPHHGGLLVGKPATNKTFRVQHIRMYKIVNGKITERKAVRDYIAMYQQLGLLPAAPPFRAAPAAPSK